MLMIGQRKIDLGEATDEQTRELFKECLVLMAEADVLTIIKDWLKDNGLEGELGD